MNNHCDCFDFPVSWDFYRAHCWEFHGFDPGDNEPPDHPVLPPLEPEEEWSKRQWDYIKQLRAQQNHLLKKNTELSKEISILKVKVGRGTKKYKY